MLTQSHGRTLMTSNEFISFHHLFELSQDVINAKVFWQKLKGNFRYTPHHLRKGIKQLEHKKWFNGELLSFVKVLDLTLP